MGLNRVWSHHSYITTRSYDWLICSSRVNEINIYVGGLKCGNGIWGFNLSGNDCSFEKGMCGWQNVKPDFTLDSGEWVLYPCENNTADGFQGQSNDVTYSSGTGQWPVLLGLLQHSSRDDIFKWSIHTHTVVIAYLKLPDYSPTISVKTVEISHGLINILFA